MKVHVIINPAKSAKAPVLNILNRVFQEHGAQWDVSVTHGAGDAYRRAQEAAASGVDVVAVYGGDGTVTETASALVGAETPMAILPGGTGNVLAVEFGIPWQLHHAAALACRAAPHRVQAVDMGQVVRAGGDAPPAHEQAFMLRASTGFEAAVIEGTERTHKEQFGILAYGIAILQVLREPPAACYT
ncbi:MAG: NAD(+)/NADH kinase, partial [Anaerolineae bacterium]|nr:NAD(+)/NADH kinase [Anaerolineae bacterium]